MSVQGSMSSSSGNTVCGPRAPPPTPSHGNNNTSAVVNNDAFSAFLERSLGISNLVLPESPSHTSLTDCDLPLIDLGGERNEVVRRIAESAAEFGCFQVVNHGVSSEIAERAEEECNRLFELPLEKKEELCRSPGSPFGFEDCGCDTSTSMRQESFWLQKDAEQIEEFVRNIWAEGCVNLSRALEEYSSCLEKVAGEIVEMLLEGVGEWAEAERSRFAAEVRRNNASVVCVINQKGTPVSHSSRIKHSHPYILTLHYQSTSYDYHVYVDRSWVRVLPQPGSLMVTVGDIFKVWSNGAYKSVIGRPVGGDEKECCTWMTLLYSPETTASIAPIPELFRSDEVKPRYSSFSLKDYASRLQKQRFVFKDPLDRYKI